MGEYSIRKNFRNLLTNYRQKPITSVWFIGDGAGNTYPDTSDLNTIYVRNSHGIVKTVYNQRVQNIPDMPVKIGIDPEQPRLLQVIDNVQAYDAPPYPQIPPGISKILGWPGIETLWTKAEQILPWLVRPDASHPLAVDIFPITGYSQGKWVIRYSNNPDLVDLTSYVPTTGAIFALISLNADGTYSVTTPAMAASSPATLTSANVPPFEYGKQPICLVRLYAGQTFIAQTTAYTDIIDLRWINALGGVGAAQWGNISGSIPDQSDLWSWIVDLAQGRHAHGTYRWVADGLATNFDLPDVARQLEGAYDNGALVDPFLVSLSSDGLQLVFSSAPTSGHVIAANYILESV